MNSKNPLRKHLRVEELRLLLSVATLEERMLMLSLWYTGGRISEVLTMTKSNFDFARNSVTIINLKRKRHLVKTIPIPEFFSAYMKNYTVSMGDAERIFKFSRCMAWHKIKRLGERKDVNIDKGYLHPHCFRHGIAVHSIDSGVPLDVVRDILGHSNIRTTSIYLSHTTKEKREQMQKAW